MLRVHVPGISSTCKTSWDTSREQNHPKIGVATIIKVSAHTRGHVAATYPWDMYPKHFHVCAHVVILSLLHVPLPVPDTWPATRPLYMSRYSSLLHVASVCTTQAFCRCGGFVPATSRVSAPLWAFQCPLAALKLYGRPGREPRWIALWDCFGRLIFIIACVEQEFKLRGSNIAGFQSRDQQPCFSTKTKGSVCITIDLNSRRIWPGHQHGRLFFV